MKSSRIALARSMYLFIALTLVTGFHAAKAQYAGPTWLQVKASGSGTLSVVYFEGTGMVYKGTDGKMKGLCVDLLNEFTTYVKGKYGKTVRVKYVKNETNWTKFLADVGKSRGGVIGLSNVTITEERKRTLSFTPDFMVNPMVMLTHKSAPDIKSLSELKTTMKDFSAVAVKGTTHVKYLEAMKKFHNPDLKITFSASPEIVMDQTSKNNKLFTIVDLTEYYYAYKKNLPLKRQAVSVSKNKERLGFIMPKDSDWGALWNEFLTPEFKRSEKYKQIIAKNLGKQFTSLIL
ncbi:MAG: transporter substrate-binding domain-containing protein [Bacteroidota bacterium]